MYDFRIINCLERLLTIFYVMQMLYLEQNQEWISKAIFYTIELTAHVLASNLQQRVWNLIGQDCEKKEKKVTEINDFEHKKISKEIKPILAEFLELGSFVIKKNTDELHCIEKIKLCLTIFDYIEEEFEV